MLKRHVIRKLTAYCHHELLADESSRVQQHLEVCESCRQEYDSIRLAVDLASRRNLCRAPDSLWSDVVRSLDNAPGAVPGESPRLASGVRPRWAFAATGLLLIAVLGTSWYYWRLNRPSWEVARLEGKPKVGWSAIGETGRIAVGDWLETDSTSRALISVGNI